MNECCEVVPWPEGIGHGYPWRMRRNTDTNDEAAFPTNRYGVMETDGYIVVLYYDHHPGLLL